MEAIEERKMTKPNPIRILRGLLQSGEDPLTQAQLSKLLDIPVDSIRNFENSRRALTEVYLRKIRAIIGAQWDPSRALWHLAYSPEIPFTAELYRAFTTRHLDHWRRRLIEIHMLVRMLIELFIQVEREDYHRLFYRVFHFLDDLRQELRISGARRIFEKTRFTIDGGHSSQSGELAFISRNFLHLTDEELVSMSGKGKQRQGDWLNLSFLIPQLEDTSAEETSDA